MKSKLCIVGNVTEIAAHTVSPGDFPSEGASGSGAGLKTAPALPKHVFLARGSLPKPRIRKTHLHDYPAAYPAKPLVTPLCVFAAGRHHFDVVIRAGLSEFDVLDAVFNALPLPENGWCPDACKAARVGKALDGFPIWRISRGEF